MECDLELLDEEFYEAAEKMIPRDELLKIQEESGDMY